METTREAELFARVLALEALVNVLFKAAFPSTDELALRDFLDVLRERLTLHASQPVPEQAMTPAEVVNERMEAIEYWMRLTTEAPPGSAG